MEEKLTLQDLSKSGKTYWRFSQSERAEVRKAVLRNTYLVKLQLQKKEKNCHLHLKIQLQFVLCMAIF